MTFYVDNDSATHTEGVVYPVSDQTHVNKTIRQNIFASVMAFFLDIAYADSDYYPSWHDTADNINIVKFDSSCAT